MENLHSSEFWLNHFQENAQTDRINWQQKIEMSEREKEVILPSLKAIQLGATSNGLRLTRATEKHAQRYQDPEYLEVVKLFIQEENKHGENLGKYLDLLGERRKKTDWGDSLFRWVRGLNTNMEIWTITALIIESASQIYFHAIQEATRCKLLKEVCADILTDEEEHLRFQRERLSIIFNRKPLWKKSLAYFIYHLHFKMTYRVVWAGHAEVFKAGGYTYNRFRRLMHHKFNVSMSQIGSDTSIGYSLKPLRIYQ